MWITRLSEHLICLPPFMHTSPFNPHHRPGKCVLLFPFYRQENRLREILCKWFQVMQLVRGRTGFSRRCKWLRYPSTFHYDSASLTSEWGCLSSHGKKGPGWLRTHYAEVKAEIVNIWISSQRRHSLSGFPPYTWWVISKFLASPCTNFPQGYHPIPDPDPELVGPDLVPLCLTC